MTQKCVICTHRPARTDEGYCKTCASQIEAERRHKKMQSEKPVKYLTYRGSIVGLFKDGNKKLEARLLRGNPELLPKTKTLDLNKYCPGFDRSQIKAFKACCLKLSNA